MSMASEQVPRFFCIAGPTASGKSAVAAEVAARCDAEIVGADAFQVYTGLAVLTAQPTPDQQAMAPHHLTGCVPVWREFDVAQYRALALAALRQIAGRGRIPLVVGGSGLYLRVLTHGLATLPPADPALRARLATLPLSELVARYERLDPQGAATIDRHNPRRLVRAIEVCELTGRPFSSFRTQWSGPGACCAGVVLTRPRAELDARIEARAGEILAGGAIAEVQAASPRAGRTARQAIGFRQIEALLRGETSLAECRAAIAQATRQYAKRQLTWFRHEPNLQHLDLSSFSDHSSVVKAVVQAVRAVGRLEND